MKLDAKQEQEAREWAGKLGRPPEEIIREAEAAKEEGYKGAYEAAQGSMERIGGVGLGMTGGPKDQVEKEAFAGLGGGKAGGGGLGYYGGGARAEFEKEAG